MRIVDLKIGDLVGDDSGAIGKVLRFTRDFVLIQWDGSAQPGQYSDDGLGKCGVVLVEGQ